MLGHGEKINREYYAGLLRIDPRAKTLEQAMRLEAIIDAPPTLAHAPSDIEAALAANITQAFQAGQWDLATELTRELRSRRESK